MERLTGLHCKKSDGYYAKCSEHCNDICDCNCEKWGEVVDRLGAYEDTGLEPEEVEQIKRAAVYMMFEDVAHFVRYTLSNFDELQKYKALGDYNRLRELKQADDEGRCVVTELAPGDEVWVVERDEDGNPDDFSGYIFITSVRGIAIVSPSINGCADLDFLLSDFVEETAMSGSGDFSGYPIVDCYGTCEEAKAALREAEG